MADEQAPPKKSKMKWIILIVFILLLGGGAAGGWFFFLKDKIGGASEPQPATSQTATAGAAQPGQVVPLPVFRVNLADPLGKRFIKLVVEVEAATPSVVEELGTHQAKIRDSIILLLSSKSYADLAPVESKVMLKSEINERINQILGGPKVLQVYITDIVIQ